MKEFAKLLILGAFLAGGLLLSHLTVFSHTLFGRAAEIRIEPGMSLTGVAQLLYEKGMISRPTPFRFYVFLSGKGRKIRAGDYAFEGPMTPAQILGLLLKGDFSRIKVTIAEGWTAREIARSLQGFGLVDEADFLQRIQDPEFIRSLGLEVPTLEGYLFPDTYEVYPAEGAEKVIRRLVEHFRKNYTEKFQARAREMGRTDFEIVTLASIVEKETALLDERPLIASVFFNRLKRHMPLASDPTVIYGLPSFSGNLTRADLERPWPYNTYLNLGLPPTPISNPGRESIRAVLYPAETDYLYFVSKNDGTHHFSKTFEEHLRAVRRYQIWRQVDRPRRTEGARPR